MWKWNDGSDYLIHHGVKGQKWGVRNGPPYPLENVRNRLVGYKSLDDIPTYDTRWSTEEHCKVVNPKYGSPGYTHNCLNCVTALEMRERGFAVQANSCDDSVDVESIEKIFKVDNMLTNDDYWADTQNPIANKVDKSLPDSDKSDAIIREMLLSMPRGSRMVMGSQYKLDGNSEMDGHIVYLTRPSSISSTNPKIAEMLENYLAYRVDLYDPQDGSHISIDLRNGTQDLKKNWTSDKEPYYTFILRVDNLELRPENLDSIVENVPADIIEKRGG